MDQEKLANRDLSRFGTLHQCDRGVSSADVDVSPQPDPLQTQDIGAIATPVRVFAAMRKQNTLQKITLGTLEALNC